MVFVECLSNPKAYSRAQVDRALLIAFSLNRGRLLLLEPPAHCPLCLGTIGVFCTHCGRS